MEYPSYDLRPIEGSLNRIPVEELQEQVDVLNEWRQKAIVQLEYFHAACRMYNFYNAEPSEQLYELLHAGIRAEGQV